MWVTLYSASDCRQRSADPLGSELGVISDEAAYGRDVGEALKDMAERLDMQDMRFLAVAVTIQQQSGGNLAEILARSGSRLSAPASSCSAA